MIFYFVAIQLFAAADLTALSPDLGGEGRVRGSQITTGFGDRRRTLAAIVAALFFSIHPLRVESVVWVTERRDVLSAFWLLAALWCYLRRQEPTTRGIRRLFLAASLTCFVLSLLSKAWGITFPIVLLILDVYPLGRFRAPDVPSRAGGRGLIAEKLLFIVPAVVVAAAAHRAQSASGAAWTTDLHPVSLRIMQAFFGLTFYVRKTFWPTELSPLYEQDPRAAPFDLPHVLAAGVVLAAALLAWRLRRRLPSLGVSMLIYVVVLSPVLGLFQSGPQLVADRYSYLACVPIALLVAALIARAWSREPRASVPAGILSDPVVRARVPGASRVVLIAAVAVLVGCLVFATQRQCRIWTDSFTLWTSTLQRTPDNGVAHANMAVLLNGREEYNAARSHALAALKRLPGNAVAHAALGRASLALGDLDQAELALRRAVDVAAAIHKPNVMAMNDLAWTLDRRGRAGEAETLYREIVTLVPDDPISHFSLAGFLAARERFDDAESELRAAIRLDPTRVEAYFRLGVLQHRMGRSREAVKTWEAGLVNDPNDIPLLIQLALILATHSDAGLADLPRALALAQRAADASAKPDARVIDALAAAQAAGGDFPAAAATISSFLDRSDGSPDPGMLDHLQRRLDAYRERRLPSE